MWEGKMASSKVSRNETAPKHSPQKKCENSYLADPVYIKNCLR